MPSAIKRACDNCIIRKIRCDGSLPCQRCSKRSQLSCTYLLPTRKRGPKFSKLRPCEVVVQRRERPISRHDSEEVQSKTHDSQIIDADVYCPATTSHDLGLEEENGDPKIPFEILELIIDMYETRMFPVWPVIGSQSLLQQLQHPDNNIDAYIVSTALCAATMAQLHVGPLVHDGRTYASEDLERECRRSRALVDYRIRPDLKAVVTSFFLHVYHAKMDNQTKALLYIQEAIAFARMLHLDEDDGPCEDSSSEDLAHGKIIYLLMWVTERGYAIQYGLPISLHHTISLSSIQKSAGDICIRGLINLASLFVTFDSSSIPQFSRYNQFPVSKYQLIELEGVFADTASPQKHLSVAQQADFFATKHWMQVLLWQQAMSRGFLSSESSCDFLGFEYPGKVCREALRRIRLFSTEDLVPLGRDQLVKLFEVANTLADTLLCSSRVEKRASGQLGPPDFLHGLYQFISPMLELDGVFHSMLRQKTAEVLVRSPTRFWLLDCDMTMENESIVEGVVDNETAAADD